MIFGIPSLSFQMVPQFTILTVNEKNKTHLEAKQANWYALAVFSIRKFLPRLKHLAATSYKECFMNSSPLCSHCSVEDSSANIPPIESKKNQF